MCQIFIIHRDKFVNEQAKYENHLSAGSRANDHGCSALFIDDMGNHSLIRAMQFDVILDMMTINDSWEQIVIHQRYTTQGAANLANTHLWQVGNYFYCHNGVLQSEDCVNFDVDSQNIGSYLETGTVWDAIAYCQSEDYANTFIVNLDDKKLYITRSEDNTLFTDGNGKYSTKELKGEIDKLVPKNEVVIHNLDIEDYDKWGYSSNLDYYNSFNDTRTYEQKVADSTHGNDASTLEKNVNEIELEMNAGSTPSLDDVVEIEQAMHNAIAAGDEVKERKYNYLLEKAHGNG